MVTGDAGPGAPVFDLLGPLPTGTMVLEASAGTGKTFTIAGLVARYVAEGHCPLDRVLAVTFGRAATQELRERVRERLVSARDALADAAAARSGADALVRLLADVDDAELAARRRRLADALASFDAATVATTHEFCLRVLQGLGTAGDLAPGTHLVESLDDLLVEVVEDLYLRRWWRDAAPPGLTPAEALAVGRAAVGDPQARLIPDDPAPESAARVRVRFARAVREEVGRRAVALRLLGFDDLLRRLRDVLVDPATGEAACGQLRRRFAVVLVDEFQDTDPVQWEVLRTAFHGHATLVLIGDPKQAIYAFRGADVTAYLAAVRVAGGAATLGTNWRSDAPLLRGTQALLRGATLGERIVVGPVAAAHAGSSLFGPGPVRPGRTAEPGPPVRLRALPRDGLPRSNGGLLLVAPARAAVAADLAGQARALLTAGALVQPRGQRQRPLGPGDVAVLVQTHAQAETARAALTAAGVPAVRTGVSSVFATQAAQEWLVLLEALEQPHRTGRVRRLAVSPLVGWSAAQLDAGGEQAVDGLGLVIRHWVAVLEERGVAALFEAVSAGQQVPARVLAQAAGERLLTDLRHVAQALHAVALDGRLGLAALLSWLRRRVDEAGADQAQERSRRLDSDAAAVQVVTVHASKGLEFPYVFVPFAWDRWVGEPPVPLAHTADGTRVRDVGGPTGPGWATSLATARGEDAAESLRLLYVAMTRAQSRLTLWWAPSTNTPCAPLHRLLFAPHPARVPEQQAVPRTDTEALALLRTRAAAAGGTVAVEVVDSTGAGAELPSPSPPAAPDLAAASFTRALDTAWRRTSYTALTSGSHDDGPPVGSEPEVAVLEDETEIPPGGSASVEAGGDRWSAGDALLAVPSPMAHLPGGTGFGTLVHAVLEELDTDAADLRGQLREQAATGLARYGAGLALTPDVLADALLPALRTPLGALTDGRALADVATADRLRELDFELPLAGGEHPGSAVVLGDAVPLLRRHLPAADPLAAYADALAVPGLAEQPLRGFLTGSIDAVLRVGGTGEQRYIIVDYKTNRLAPPDQALTAWHYRGEALAAAMVAAHYPLQALLYAVALHRFLRWRQPGYDPRVHLGGVLYLFLRGMAGLGIVGSDDSVPGVFSWHPPAALVVGLSDLLAGRRPG